MLFVIAVGLIFLGIVVATGLVEAWARHKHWQGYDDRPVRPDPRRPWGKGW